MPAIPRWLAVVWIVAGSVGMAASVIVAVAGARFVNGAARSGLEIVAVTRGLLSTASDTAVIIDDIVTQSADGLETVESSVVSGADTLSEVAALAEDLGTVVAEDIPGSLDELNDTMPQLIATAGVIDGVMRTLAFVGVEYDPDDPLDDALRDMEGRLEAIPVELRAQSEGFGQAADGIAAFAGSTVDIAAEVGSIRRTLDDSRQVLAQYEETVADGTAVLDELEARLEQQVDTARAGLLLLGLALAFGQTVPVAFGVWGLRQSDADIRAAA